MTAPRVQRPVSHKDFSSQRIGLLFAAPLFFLVVLREDIGQDTRVAAWASVISVILSVWAHVHFRGPSIFSLGLMYSMLFGIFHIGLLISVALATTPNLINPGDIAWALGANTGAAATTAAIAQLSFTVGSLTARSRSDVPPAHDSPAVQITGLDGAGLVGSGMVLAGVVLWMKNTLGSGVTLVGSSYGDFLASTRDTDMPIAYILMGFGMAVAAASRHKGSRAIAISAFVTFAVPGFLIGLRGEMIIPAAAYLIVASRQRPFGWRPWMVVVPAALLALGSAVRVIRQHGLGQGAISANDFNPLNGLAELGYSIRPLIMTHHWHDRLAEDFVGASTYLAPVRRVLLGRVLGLPSTPTTEDPAVFSSTIMARVGPIGGSPAAEAYRAGGTLAVIIVLCLVGILIARLDSLPARASSSAAVGMAAFALLLWVRNDFTPAVVEISVLIAVLGAIRLVDMLAPSNSRTKLDARASSQVGRYRASVMGPDTALGNRKNPAERRTIE